MASLVSEDELTFLVPGNGGPLVLGHPQTDYTPVEDTDIVNKKYVDGGTLTAHIPLRITGTDLTIDAAGAEAGGYITIGAQTIAGVKTFNSLPVIPNPPLANTDAACKKYVDDQALSASVPLRISAKNITVDDAGAAQSGVVNTAAQTFAGVKTFSSLPIIPNPPLAATDAACKGYVDGMYVHTTPTLVFRAADNGIYHSVLGVDVNVVCDLCLLSNHIVVMSMTSGGGALNFTKTQNGVLWGDGVPVAYRPASGVAVSVKVYNVDTWAAGWIYFSSNGHFIIGSLDSTQQWTGTATGNIAVDNFAAVWYI